MKTNIIPRDYQLESIKFLETEHDKLVLAMCPSSGKTETIIHYIDDLYKQNENVKVLILPHSTNVLLDNFYQRLESRNVSYTYSTDTSVNCNVHVILPQSHSKIKDKYDVVIVDEAHENYFAKTVQNILERTSPTKQILLTGTPYQFVDKKEFKIHFLALNDLDSSLLPKLRFDIIESDYEWNGNYNNLGEIKSSFIFKKENTDKTLDDTFKFIFDRENFKEVNKTLIVCKSINQSELVKSYLDNIGVCSEVSNSKNDTKSDIVNDFKQNKIKVLIVVNRARLGYDDSHLVNLIDMSGTLNPNIIYQMFARLLRGDNSQQKYYIRLTSKNDDLLNSELSTSLALMLTDKKYIQVFNGKNFKEKDIIIKKDLLLTLKNNQKSNKKVLNSRRILVETDDIINFYKKVIIDTENNIGLYKSCKVSEVLSQLKNKYTLEYCKIIALKYNRRVDWKKNKDDSASFNYAYKNGWLDECCVDMIIRIKEHTLESCKESASKYKTRSEWMKNDHNPYQYAHKKGWVDECCINMPKIRRITLEICKESASKYKKRHEWQKNDVSTYSTAHRKGWLDECCVNMESRKRHTLESCKESASKYKTKVEWFKNDKTSYATAQKKGWLDECCINLQTRKINTLESCKESASKYKTRGEWFKNEKKYYETAQRKGWLDECCINMESRKKHTLESCKKNALEYKTRTQWAKNDFSTYSTAQKKGWLDECCINMKPVLIIKKYTLESCKESASKYKTKVEWLKNEKNYYEKAQREGWLDECCVNMVKIKKYTLEMCKESASKYKTREEWRKNNYSLYYYAYKNNWLDKCCVYMKSPHIKHTLESCKEIASKYKTRIEWQNSDRNSYASACRYKWVDECCVNMEVLYKKHTFDSCKESASKYKTRGEWQKNDSASYQFAYRKKWIDEFMPIIE